ncbi:RNA polymerase recycling motor ATPase HelR [Arthrobacter sp. Y-9]|uniref:RNA polymerase recycling motor ATPase HelR n=1 Tax=Arthrobacter sp. Y-9 TaxID=3039385 RepID=UPI00241D543A|nr:RNA polymerase recycling motor ATPase HelR [Arthrobacter sp. Y-9]WFR82553.1 RNA polymerase recycling motor ATPase HelR [Arthrobacter sp. Y-9]
MLHSKGSTDTIRGEAIVAAITPSSVFQLPERLAAKADPALIADDERHFAAIADNLDRTRSDLSERLDAARRAPGRSGQQAVDRDAEIRRLTGRLRALERYGLDLCLGRFVPADGSAPVYIGRLGLTDADGERLLVDWRAPAAEPFSGATHAHPQGVGSRRRYRWSGGHIVDYWDEAFSPGGVEGAASLGDLSAFIASLGHSRTPRMRDVLGTIQADQDAIIRASSQGALVVDGGPGTGKTVVALHRAAYLLYADPRLSRGRGGVLLVGPHRHYLSYVADVLPGLGEEGVQACTIRDLVPEGAAARAERDPKVARLKSSAEMVRAIEKAVRFYEEPPTEGLLVETPYQDVWVSPDAWAEAFAAPAPGTPHNEARAEVWDELLTLLVATTDDGEAPDGALRSALARNGELAAVFNRAWPLLEHTVVVGDLWRVPAFLSLCAPWLTPEEVRVLQREEPRAWTLEDLPLLDAARLRLGDPEEARRVRRRRAEQASERDVMNRVVEDLIAADDSEMLVMSMLKGEDLQEGLGDEGLVGAPSPDLLAGPFGHVIVDEAQELSDAEWQMLLARCPSGSLTIVGDRAQARQGFPESWAERLERVGVPGARVSALSINYRTPEEVMAEAAPAIRSALPDANVPTSVRSSGVPVRRGAVAELDTMLSTWLAENTEGIACVIRAVPEDEAEHRQAEDPADDPRVTFLTAEEAKGLEFDLVVLVDPAGFGAGIEVAVDRYVAMTRATRELVILEG